MKRIKCITLAMVVFFAVNAVSFAADNASVSGSWAVSLATGFRWDSFETSTNDWMADLAWTANYSRPIFLMDEEEEAGLQREMSKLFPGVQFSDAIQSAHSGLYYAIRDKKTSVREGLLSRFKGKGDVQVLVLYSGMTALAYERVFLDTRKPNIGSRANIDILESIRNSVLGKAVLESDRGNCLDVARVPTEVMKDLGYPGYLVSVTGGNYAHAIGAIYLGGKVVANNFGELYAGRSLSETLGSYEMNKGYFNLYHFVTETDGSIIGEVRTPIGDRVFERFVTKRLFSGFLQGNIVNGSLRPREIKLRAYGQLGSDGNNEDEDSRKNFLFDAEIMTTSVSARIWQDEYQGTEIKGYSAFYDIPLNFSGIKLDLGAASNNIYLNYGQTGESADLNNIDLYARAQSDLGSGRFKFIPGAELSLNYSTSLFEDPGIPIGGGLFAGLGLHLQYGDDQVAVFLTPVVNFRPNGNAQNMDSVSGFLGEIHKIGRAEPGVEGGAIIGPAKLLGSGRFTRLNNYYRGSILAATQHVDFLAIYEFRSQEHVMGDLARDLFRAEAELKKINHTSLSLSAEYSIDRDSLEDFSLFAGVKYTFD